MDIVQERLEREYNLELVTSAPTVVYEVAKTDGTVVYVDNPAKLPPLNETEEIREPIIIANILVPPDHVGAVLKLCTTSAAGRRKCSTWPPRCHCSTSCRWPKWCSISSIA